MIPFPINSGILFTICTHLPKSSWDILIFHMFNSVCTIPIVILSRKERRSDCQKRGHRGKLLTWHSNSSLLFPLDSIFLTAVLTMRFPRRACRETKYVKLLETGKRKYNRSVFCILTVAVAIMADSNGASKEAGCPAEVAGTRVSDIVIATDCLLRWHGNWTRSCAAHDTVSTVGLVSHTGVGTWAHHVGAWFCVRHEGGTVSEEHTNRFHLTVVHKLDNFAYFCTLLGTWPPGLGVPCSGPAAGCTHPCMTSHHCRTQRASGKCESNPESKYTEAFPSSFCKPSQDCIGLPHTCLQKHSGWFHTCTAHGQSNITVLTSL